MSTTTQEIARRRLAAALRDAGGSGAPAARQSLSARFLASEAYRTVRDGQGPIPEAARSTQVASTRELVSDLRLRTFADLTPFSIDPEPYVASLPLQALLPQLVETIPTTSDAVRLSPESSDQPAAGGGPAGVPLPEPAESWGASGALTPLARFGTAWPVSRGVLDDEGVVQSILEGRLRGGFTFGLENLILAAPAGDPNGTGVLANGVPALAKGGADVYRLDTIQRAAAAVHGAGWYTAPLACVAHPTTLQAVAAEKSAAGALYVFDPDLVPIEAWVPSTQIAPGQAVVGDWFDAVAMFVKDGLAVEMSSEHEDFYTRGLISMMIATRALVWVRNPSALALCTGL